MFCDLSPYQSRRCKEIIEGKVKNSENVRGLIEFIDAKFKTRAISAFYGAGRNSAWLKIVLRFDKDAAKITDKKCIERYLARTPLFEKLNGLRNFYISIESFESQIRTDLIQGAVEELLRNRNELLAPLKIWYIAAASDAPVVFYFTRQDAARREGGGKIERLIRNFIEKARDAKYLSHMEFKLYFDSKEFVDLEYGGNLFYYFK